MRRILPLLFVLGIGAFLFSSDFCSTDATGKSKKEKKSSSKKSKAKTNDIKHSIPKLTNVTDDAGFSEKSGTFFAWGDYNNDGYPDLLVDGHSLYENSGKPEFKFTDVTNKVGLEKASGSAAWADYNNDGWLDFATTSGQLWKNEKGKFTEVGKDAKLTLANGVIAIGWGDYDADGYVDLYVGVGEGPGYTFVPHQLFHNKGDGTFEDVSEKMAINKKAAYGRSIIWCDYDNDGRQDIYVGNYRLCPNFLWHNNKDNTLTNVADKTGTAGEFEPARYTDPEIKKQYGEEKAKFGPHYGHTIGCAWADFNNDGLFDIWVSNLVHKYIGPANFGKGQTYDIRGYVCDDSKIYINKGAPDFKFEDIRDKSGIPRRPIGGRGVYTGDELWSNAVCADFDNDNFVDVFVTQIYNLQYAYALLYRNKGDLTFQDIGNDLNLRYIDTYGAAWADYNCDGYMDIVIGGRSKVDGPQGIHLFKNEGNGLSWLEFKLEGKECNRAAIGAKVEIQIGDLKMVRQVEGSSGSHTQQNDMTLHFGLGKYEGVDEATIYWPGGKVQKLGKQKARKIITIKEK